MRLLAICAVLFALLAPQCEATTYSYWYSFTDTRGSTVVPCRWRVSADVIDPTYGTTYRSGGSSTAQVAHASYNVMFLEALSSYGLGTGYYTLVGDLRRWDTGGNFWRYFDDAIIAGYYPPYEGPMSYNRGFRNPYTSWGSWYVDSVYQSPVGQAHYCDATMGATSHERSYSTIQVTERVPYYVRP